MKGFPNQVADLTTLTAALKVMASLLGEGRNVRDDGIYGEALIRKKVLRTGHTAIPVAEYLRQQKSKQRASDQSFRTRARGLRELFRILGLVDDSAIPVAITPTGQRILALDSAATTLDGLRLWRPVILRMTHDGGDDESSHPYQVLLRLVAKCPGITRAKCALALEAKNDSEEELARIVKLSTSREDLIRQKIGCTKSNWDNAKKILPRFAEQLGDVRKLADKFYLADIPGSGGDVTEEQKKPKVHVGPRKPKQSSSVTAATIARAATLEGWDEADEVDEERPDPESLAQRTQKIRERLHRHNLLVQKIAAALEKDGAKLFENPFDCLGVFPKYGLLLEVKTLDLTFRRSAL